MAIKKPYVWVEQAVIIRALRRLFRTYPPFQEVRNRCKREWWEQCKNGNKRRRVHFECETCHNKVDAKDFAVDHTDPVIDPIVGFVDYNTYVQRLFCPIANLSGMCYDCHTRKSREENAVRAKIRKEKKNGTKSGR